MNQDRDTTQPGGRRLRVGVIFGGRSAEHDVSLRSAQTVMGALEAAGHEIVPVGVTSARVLPWPS